MNVFIHTVSLGQRQTGFRLPGRYGVDLFFLGVQYPRARLFHRVFYKRSVCFVNWMKMKKNQTEKTVNMDLG